MKRSITTVLRGSLSVIVALVFLVTVAGCGNEKGTMEKAGKKADESMGQAKDTVQKADKKAGEEIDKAKKDLDDAAEKAREKNRS